MTGIIYSRYSSDSQREESIEGQIRECKAYAEKNGVTALKSSTVLAASSMRARAAFFMSRTSCLRSILPSPPSQKKYFEKSF